ncbi:hypothetical protein I553_3858 [Mycobacterium xenopi 4042]|uniref:Uncharacterized protein n=1 Tax=Mycobacterium xenopi 4042 TaxID=1299334 RepID=X8AME4_MYCXE|nr:hypothetical protein I553_3858 [Mycobacterium xenopi 4042]
MADDLDAADPKAEKSSPPRRRPLWACCWIGGLGGFYDGQPHMRGDQPAVGVRL